MRLLLLFRVGVLLLVLRWRLHRLKRLVRSYRHLRGLLPFPQESQPMEQAIRVLLLLLLHLLKPPATKGSREKPSRPLQQHKARKAADQRSSGATIS